MRNVILFRTPRIAAAAIVVLIVGLLALACTGGDPPVTVPPALTAAPTQNEAQPTSPPPAAPTDATKQPETDQPRTEQPQPGPSPTPDSDAAPAPTSEAPTAPPAPATPTPVPVVKPPGYHHGIEHGVALVQTTREPSREGWVDITLLIAVVKFDGLLSTMEFKHEPSAICLVTSSTADDCLLVAWGSEEQFEAELDTEAPDEFDLPSGKSLLLPVTFGIASNATKASLFFGDDTQIALNLPGDLPVPEAPAKPTPVGPVAGYFVDSQYGISVVGVRRERLDSVGSWIHVDLEIISTPGPEELTAVVRSEVIGGDVCFVGNAGNECLSVLWGNRVQFNQILRFKDDEVRWPRGLGWPTTFQFPVPNNVDSATIEFGSHQIPIALTGMEGQTPSYDYRAHYPEILPDTVLYDSNRKRVVLHAIEHDAETGEILLRFIASNDSEATDFAPTFRAIGTRVSASGKIFDGLTHTWAPPVVVDTEIEAVPPGGTSPFVIRLSRGFARGWDVIPSTADYEDLPDSAIVQFEIADRSSDAESQVAEPGFLQFERSPNESAYYPEPGTELWRYDAGGAATAPIVYEGVVYVGSTNGHLSALDAATGERLWHFVTFERVAHAPTLSDGVAYVVSGDDVFALNAESGQLSWRTDMRMESWQAHNFSPVVEDGIVFGGVRAASSNNRYLYALDEPTGTRLWRYEYEYGDSRPVVVDSVVYLEVGGIHTLYTRGELLIKLPALGRGILTSQNAVADGVLYVGSYNNFYAQRVSTGAELWQFTASETGRNRNYSTPAVTDGVNSNLELPSL